MKRSLSSLVMLCALVCAGFLAACAGAPTAGGVAAIQNACAIDAGLRPTVSALLIFATPQEVAAVGAARAVIDPVCANPNGTYEANTVAAVTAASAQVLGVLAELKSRQGHPPSPAPAASAVVSLALIPRVTA